MMINYAKSLCHPIMASDMVLACNTSSCHGIFCRIIVKSHHSGQSYELARNMLHITNYINKAIVVPCLEFQMNNLSTMRNCPLDGWGAGYLAVRA